MAEVILKSVRKVYDKNVVAVDGANIEIKDKEFVVLVGPSGCGKSTTLRMVAGLEEITSGEIYIDGVLVNDIPPKDRDIAMVFQNYALYPHMSVYQNMAFGLKLRKYPKEEIDARVREAADILGIHELLERKPKALSGGQRQRVAVGRAIVRKPKVFLFDEPLSNLDAKLRVQMRTEISKLHLRLGATMIYVTHDQTEAMTMGDRIVVMKDGRIHQIDTPLSLYNNPVDQFVAGFIGSPAMNFIPGSLVKNGSLVFDEGNIRIPLPASYEQWLNPHAGKEVVFGIRPEDIHDPATLGSGMNTVQITAKVEVVEPLGSEVFLYLTTGKTSFVARVDPLHMPVVDQEVKLAVEIEKAHFFDKDSDASLIHRN
ncbi:MAG: sn-glycerol-3-phosphate ABC transporter ATP-binding protein UgpC [Candidatus Handelsmanbacteria bacterium]|nr:sn-glycerol-3-phosphate ABC transporter ATP-binding protein UgpC [Candidatus Handelsmanbacteria bacterium]